MPQFVGFTRKKQTLSAKPTAERARAPQSQSNPIIQTKDGFSLRTRDTSAQPTTSLNTKERLQATVRGLGPNHPHDHGTTKQKHYRHTLRERSKETTTPMRVTDLNPSNLARRAARHLSFRRPCSRSPQPRRYLTVCYCWPVPPTRVCARERQ